MITMNTNLSSISIISQTTFLPSFSSFASPQLPRIIITPSTTIRSCTSSHKPKRQTISYDHHHHLLFPNAQERYSKNDSQINHSKNISIVRDMLFSKEGNKASLQSMMLIDTLQHMGHDHLFKEEIGSTLSSIYDNFTHQTRPGHNLFESSLFFRLFRQHGYRVSPKMLKKFIAKNGEFKLASSKDIKGLMSLYEASHLNIGEDILRKGKEFSSKHLWDSIEWLDNKHANQVKETLEHPYHMSIQRYKARRYISMHQDDHENGCKDVVLFELAKYEFNIVQLLHQREFNAILSWWKKTGLAQELSFVRDQPLKWYMWPLTMVPQPHHSKCRIELTKAIAFIYIIDDIFDVYGTLDELSLFTQAINKWDISAIDNLPNYMKVCFNALYNVTNEIAETTLKEYGWNPINTLSKSWGKLCNAFLQEAKWFASKQVPNKDEYLRNAVTSSGVFIVIVHLFFLMGQGLTLENIQHIENDPSFVSISGTILRLWDDLGSAKDENQKGFDGSYLELYMKEHQECTAKEAQDQVMVMISRTWEALNKESFTQSSFPQPLINATLNLARMVRVMYSYNDDNHHLPMLDDYIFSLLHHPL
ncbi:(3S)-linalool synthase protein [Dioscorea alata]|uniref:(3S)-linalool synthase protein n=1 Tax=Dioscorea alata TaxID=55571 RepID=A0ACB7V4R9_DIOAL|nr:(3S)-linalool synthase protein [Dioscorea alata]